MPPGLRIYLDTSVISAAIDDRDPLRRRLTERFWQGLPAYEPFISQLVLDELAATPDAASREHMLARVARFALAELSGEVELLTAEYIRRGVFSTAMAADARHVAAAVVARVPILVSWNYRHLVHRERRLRVNRANSDLGVIPIEIVTPPELT